VEVAEACLVINELKVGVGEQVEEFGRPKGALNAPNLAKNGQNPP